MLELLHARLREAAQRLIDEVSAEEMIDLLPEARRRALLHSYTLRTRRTLLANDLTTDERVAALQDCLASERAESGILRARVSVLESALAAYFTAYEENGWVSVEMNSELAQAFGHPHGNAHESWPLSPQVSMSRSGLTG